MKWEIAFVLIIVVLFIPVIGLADVTDDAWLAYLAGDFNHVAHIVQAGLSDTSLTSDQKAKLSFTLGCSHAMQNRDFAADDAFRIAFSFNPTLTHSSMELPPPVWRIFKPIQDSAQAKLTVDVKRVTESTGIKTRIDTLRVFEPVYHEKATIIRSLAFPGWGHLYVGNRRGYRYVIGEAILLGGFAYSIKRLGDAHEDYSNARNSSDIAKYYSDYNLQYKTSWGLGAMVVGFYLFSQWDLFSHPPAISISSANPGCLQIGFNLRM